MSEAFEQMRADLAQAFAVPLFLLGGDRDAQPPRPTAAAERTRSPQRRAGSRRTKKHARRPR